MRRTWWTRFRLHALFLNKSCRLTSTGPGTYAGAAPCMAAAVAMAPPSPTALAGSQHHPGRGDGHVRQLQTLMSPSCAILSQQTLTTHRGDAVVYQQRSWDEHPMVIRPFGR